MANRDIILEFLKSNRYSQYCDDCLSELLNIRPRQTINILCRSLESQQLIVRTKAMCSQCSRHKITNRIGNPNYQIQTKITPEDILDHAPTSSKQSSKLSGDDFEELVGQYLQSKFGQQFKRNESLMIGQGKFHKFDWVSSDGNIVVECKNYTWTKSGNSPSAKFATLVETLFYFSRIKANRKILVMRESLNSNAASLVDTFVDRYEGILDDVEIWKYNIETNSITIARKAQKPWCVKLRSDMR